MARPARTRLTSDQKQELWRRWRAGESIAHIARALDRFPASVRDILLTHGGIAPRTPSRSTRVLSSSERESISRGLAQGFSVRQIATQIGRAPSTISREVARHGGREAYRAEHADRRAWKNARRPKPCLLASQPRVHDWVAEKLLLNWSPEQIAGRLKLEFPDDETMRVSHETIYRSLYIQARGALKKELMAHLRSHRLLRRSKLAGTTQDARGKIADAVSISERPAEAQDRAVPGHWEGDLIAGTKNTFIATLVERHSRFTMLVKVDSKHTEHVVAALGKQIGELPAALRKSLTWDRGKELSQHKAFTVATNIQVYFCDPHHPWQRGSNENTNGLLRQYFPKGSDVSRYSQEQLDAVALQLNQRPRETLGFNTPAQRFEAAVASTR